MTGPGPAVRINSRMGEARPDVEHDGPLRHALEPLLDRFAAGEFGGAGFQARLLDILAALGPERAGTVAAARTARACGADVTLWRRDFGGRDVTVSMIHLAPGEVHPPHHHHNVTSVQIVLEGPVTGREYDRICRIDEGHILLRPLSDGDLPPGSLLLAHEWSRNAHWFRCSEEAPALIWNCNARGFERSTFDPADGRPLGRRLLAPTGPLADGGIRAAELDVATAYATFGGRPLEAWPLPMPPQGSPPPLRPDLLAP